LAGRRDREGPVKLYNTKSSWGRGLGKALGARGPADIFPNCILRMHFRGVNPSDPRPPTLLTCQCSSSRPRRPYCRVLATDWNEQPKFAPLSHPAPEFHPNTRSDILTSANPLNRPYQHRRLRNPVPISTYESPPRASTSPPRFAQSSFYTQSILTTTIPS
jgi:hypothetical protein